MPDYYSVLGVSQNADTDTIKARYRKLAKENHPDLHPGDKAAEHRFKGINEAWEILGDDYKRAKYDKSRTRSHTGKKRKEANSAGVTADDIMGQFDKFFSKVAQPGSAVKTNAAQFDADALFSKYLGIKKK